MGKSIIFNDKIKEFNIDKISTDDFLSIADSGQTSKRNSINYPVSEVKTIKDYRNYLLDSSFLISEVFKGSGKVSKERKDLIKRKEQIIIKLEEFKNLKKNWDDMESEKPNYYAINKSSQIAVILLSIKPISIEAFPLKDGGIQLEFEDETFEYEIETHPDNEIIFIKYDKEGEILKKLNLSNDIWEIYNFLNELLNKERGYTFKKDTIETQPY